MPFLHLSPFCRHGRQAEKAKILAFCRDRRPRRSVYVAACFYGGRTKSLLVSLGIHLLRKWTPPPPLRANNHCGAKWEGPHELAVAIVGIGTDSRGRLSLQRRGEDVKFCSFSSLKVLGGWGTSFKKSPTSFSAFSAFSAFSTFSTLSYKHRPKLAFRATYKINYSPKTAAPTIPASLPSVAMRISVCLTVLPP